MKIREMMHLLNAAVLFAIAEISKRPFVRWLFLAFKAVCFYTRGRPALLSINGEFGEIGIHKSILRNCV